MAQCNFGDELSIQQDKRVAYAAGKWQDGATTAPCPA